MAVIVSRRVKPSGNILKEALQRKGYTGTVKFGFGENKRIALEKMAEAGVPVPKVWRAGPDSYSEYPVIGRPDYHHAGKAFWFCRNDEDVRTALQGTRRKRAATHFLEYIEADKEFRVHIVKGKCVKISEKVPIGGVQSLRRNHEYGYVARYPHDFHHKKSLRKWAKLAVDTLGLDIGAVDILWSEERGFFVLEVNSGPALTCKKSDTLDRYVDAILTAEGG